ncbi:hypothetical protein D3C72_2276820 [compost metagenome]
MLLAGNRAHRFTLQQASQYPMLPRRERLHLLRGGLRQGRTQQGGQRVQHGVVVQAQFFHRPLLVVADGADIAVTLPGNGGQVLPVEQGLQHLAFVRR